VGAQVPSFYAHFSECVVKNMKTYLLTSIYQIYRYVGMIKIKKIHAEDGLSYDSMHLYGIVKYCHFCGACYFHNDV